MLFGAALMGVRLVCASVGKQLDGLMRRLFFVSLKIRGRQGFGNGPLGCGVQTNHAEGFRGFGVMSDKPSTFDMLGG